MPEYKDMIDHVERAMSLLTGDETDRQLAKANLLLVLQDLKKLDAQQEREIQQMIAEYENDRK